MKLRMNEGKIAPPEIAFALLYLISANSSFMSYHYLLDFFWFMEIYNYDSFCNRVLVNPSTRQNFYNDFIFNRFDFII